MTGTSAPGHGQDLHQVKEVKVQSASGAANGLQLQPGNKPTRSKTSLADLVMAEMSMGTSGSRATAGTDG